MDIQKMLEFNVIKEKWMQLAVTEYAKKRIQQVESILEESVLRQEIRDTTSARKLMEQCGEPPLACIDEVKEIVAYAMKEKCLTPYQLERVEASLVMVQRLKDYLHRGQTWDNPIAYYEENLVVNHELRDEITRQIRGEKVDDYATKELLHIRTDMSKIQDRIKQKAEQVMRAQRDCMADSYSTIRSGRICIPVKRECRKKVKGNVIDQSATGSTLFMEPKSVAALQDELSLLEIAEENEVYRILYTLTAMVADSAEEMKSNIQMIEKLDFIFSKGKLSMDMGGVEPEINVERRLILKDARHPLMKPELSIPLQFQLGGDTRGIVITGPNTGGKTVAIKTVALNCYMAQCGLHVTCREADICMNSSYLCDIGDGQNITENLSTFSSHIKNVMEITERMDQDSLVIMDELGSGTDPTEGMGIAVAIIQELQARNCLFLLTTHYPEVKDYAEQAEGVVNARMAFDRETLRPTYHLVIGEAGESCAFYIARKLGMSRNMLENAITAAYGVEGLRDYSYDEEKDGQWSREQNFDGAEEGLRSGKQNFNGTEEGSQPGKQNFERIKEGKQPGKPKIQKMKQKQGKSLSEKFRIGDSVMVLPDQKIGIVCEPVNQKGVLRVQLPDKKIYINHKRVRLQVAATELYPEGYDFSILFDSTQVRKMRHDMERKYVDGKLEL